jgi:hypothetical protein
MEGLSKTNLFLASLMSPETGFYFQLLSIFFSFADLLVVFPFFVPHQIGNAIAEQKVASF